MLLSLAIAPALYGQIAREDQEFFRVMFYNLENLFDTYDDPLTNDDEFTDSGAKRWNYYRYQNKLNDIAKVILAVGQWNPPAIIGMCEVENYQVLLDLITKTPLASLGYHIIHENSPDERGIDVALLYRAELVERLAHSSLAVNHDEVWSTREILLATLHIQKKDTLKVLVNHWPSRYGGKENTEHKRVAAAAALRMYVDSIQAKGLNTKILILGDFNDEPTDRSLAEALKSYKLEEDVRPAQLYNLSFPDYRRGLGTLVYKEIDNTWFMFDQIIATGTLLEGKGLICKNKQSMIFKSPWLMRDDKPRRTYQGPIYLGGYSDHLPIFIDLYDIE